MYGALPTFLSTLSLRRATRIAWEAHQAGKDFYPRSPCGERQLESSLYHGRNNISIHALLAESDATKYAVKGSDYLFLSTLSLRRATGLDYDPIVHIEISIHALLAESDPPLFLTTQNTKISIHALLAESDLPIKND